VSIMVNLQGGCGNQLFQYAMGRAQALRFGTNLKVCTQWYTGSRAYLGWKPYCLDQFVGVDVEMVDSPTGEAFNEHGLEYNSREFDRVTNNCCLTGFYLSEQYFEHIAQTLREDLQPKEISDAAHEMAAKITSVGERSAFIGFRRGDFAVYGTNLSLDYYTKAIEKITAVQPDPHFFLFADDGDWVRENFKIPYEMTIASVHHNEIQAGNGHEAEDLWIMSHCQHAIVPNSSFGWWGAWLNPAPKDERVVVLPQPWHREEPNYSIVPEPWRKYAVLNNHAIAH
jgi:hypothetical protein